jgi:hypothetical protein
MSDEIIASEWLLNRRECIRVVIGSVKGHRIVNIRKWYRADDDSFRPTKDGIALGIKHLPPLVDGLVNALSMARERGLVSPDDNSNATTSD